MSKEKSMIDLFIELDKLTAGKNMTDEEITVMVTERFISEGFAIIDDANNLHLTEKGERHCAEYPIIEQLCKPKSTN